MMKLPLIASLLVAATLAATPSHACTAFCASSEG